MKNNEFVVEYLGFEVVFIKINLQKEHVLHYISPIHCAGFVSGGGLVMREGLLAQPL